MAKYTDHHSREKAASFIVVPEYGVTNTREALSLKKASKSLGTTDTTDVATNDHLTTGPCGLRQDHLHRSPRRLPYPWTGAPTFSFARDALISASWGKGIPSFLPKGTTQDDNDRGSIATHYTRAKQFVAFDRSMSFMRTHIRTPSRARSKSHMQLAKMNLDRKSPHLTAEVCYFPTMSQ